MLKKSLISVTTERAQDARNIINQIALIPECVLDHAISKLLKFSTGREIEAKALHIKKDYHLL